jgi:hypothetical protein
MRLPWRIRAGDVHKVSHLLRGERRPQRASVVQRIARPRTVAERSVCRGLSMPVAYNETLAGEALYRS